ncbi:glycosyltransferase family 39 protein [Patescibacteria group bacterium]|nr:glycosyltransferase family 39 protein [Patescibacteria group bacterium]
MPIPTKIKRALSSFRKRLVHHKKELLVVTGLFLGWRIIVWIIGFIAANRFNLSKDTAYPWVPESPWKPALSGILNLFARWDSGWYLSIAENGYYVSGSAEPSNIVFFPLYPLLMRYIGNLLGGNHLIAGMLISTAALFFACIILYFLAKKDLTKSSLAYRSVLYLLIFPYAFFLVCVYTESLFLLTVLASLYFARKDKWFFAGTFAALATATRPTGIILILVLLVEYFEQREFRVKSIKPNILWIGLTPLGIGAFMYFLYAKFGDPLLFAKAQEAWGRSTDLSITGFIKTFFTYLHDFVTYSQEFAAYYFTNAFDFLSFVIFFILSIVIFFKLRKSYGVFMFFSLIMASMTQSYISMGRFTVVLFPAFIFLAKITRKEPWKSLYLILSIMLSVIIIMLFVNSYWTG